MIRWQSIESAPQDEAGSFLVFTLCAGKEPVVVQVSRFEGRLYPDFLGAAIDWADAVTRATHWMPLPLMPSEQVTGVDATIRSEPPISSPAGALTAEKAGKGKRLLEMLLDLRKHGNLTGCIVTPDEWETMLDFAEAEGLIAGAEQVRGPSSAGATTTLHIRGREGK